MNMKKLILFLSIGIFGVLSVFAQTPYDNFAPEQGVKSMIELPQTQFRVANANTDGEVRYAEFDKNTLSLTLLDDSANVIKTLVLSPNEKKFLTIDPLCEKYYSISPYAYCMNNPVNAIDPDGKDSYLLIWFSGNNETGHAGIAVDNYKQQEVRDRRGNVVLDSKGNPTNEMVKDGTMTYYDLWPNSPVGKTELQSNVNSDYSKGLTINSLSDLQTKDPTGSRSGNVSAEGRAADGIVQINTTYDQDIRIQGYASTTANSGKAYNASNFNCSTFAENAFKKVFPALDASQFVKIPGALKLIYNDTRVVAPNNLYNATMTLPGARNIRGPKSVIAKPYLQYYGK